jgi:peptide methionine sulfoxide reductase MsrA
VDGRGRPNPHPGWQDSLDKTVVTQVQRNNTFSQADAQHQKQTLRKRNEVLKSLE